MKNPSSPLGVSHRGSVVTRFRLPAGIALAALACSPLPTARAADILWDAASPGSFVTPTNWAGDVAPTATDNAIIDNGGTAQISSGDSITVTTLQLLNGTVTQNGGSIVSTGPDENPAAYAIGWSAGFTGTYTATGGANISGGRVILGNNGGTGEFTLTGASTYVGDVGRRTDIGNGAGSTGTLNINGDSQWTTNDWLIVGRGGTGTLNISGTATSVVANGEIFVGDLGGNGTVSLGGGSTLTGGNVRVGAGGGGTSSMTVSGSSILTANGQFIVANGGTTGSVTLSDTASISAGQLFVGNNAGSVATLNALGGTITSNDWTVIGRSSSTGTATLGGSSVWTKTGGGNFSVGNGFEGNGKGTLTINDNAKLDVLSGQLWIGAEGSGGTPTDTEGTLNLNGGQVDTYDWVAVGRNDTKGTLNINGGVFNVNAVGAFPGGPNFVAIGNSTANAVINQTGGIFNNNSSDTVIGETGTSVAVWNATGGVSNHNVLRLGGQSGSQGIINIGTAAVVNAITTYVSSDGGSNGELNLNTGGTMNAGFIEGGAGNRKVRFNGGQLNATLDGENIVRDFLAGEVELLAGGLNLNTGTFTVGIATQLSGVGGIHKTGSGELVVKLPSSGPADANTYTGTTLVSAGTLRALDTNLGVGDVRVETGAHLILNINTAVDDVATIYLDGTTSTLELTFGTGLFETVGSLVVNGQYVPAGNYTVTQLNDLYSGRFSGDGGLTITTAAIPEPSTVALAIVGLGSVFFLRRRRTA